MTDLSRTTHLADDKLMLLVKAAVALDLLEQDGPHIMLGSHGAALLGQPWIMRFVEHHRHFYRDLADPVALLRGELGDSELRKYWSYGNGAADKRDYSQLMADSQKAVSQQILGAYDFGRHSKVLDVGGGSGAFLRALGAKNPNVNLNLFDLPGVSALANEHPGSERINVHAGDFRVDKLPEGMDIITVVRVLHDHDDGPVLALLRNIRRSCQPNTVLLIAEPFAGDKATAMVTDAYFNLYFAAMGQGRTRSPQEITSLAGQAGFGSGKVIRTDMPLITGVMTFLPADNM